MSDANYRAKVELLLQLIPHIAEEDCFALKGGTAINMFVWNFPRLSIDIDLTYIPFDARDTAMMNIAQALHRIKERVESNVENCKARLVPQSDMHEAKLKCKNADVEIKVEVNTIMRGHIFPTREMPVADAINKEFKRYGSMRILSTAEIFGGKICAALDRQHPRDLFDISCLYDRGGITRDIQQGFIMALLSGKRPVQEMISPRLLDQRQTYDDKFAGMANIPFSYEDFKDTRSRLIADIIPGFTDDDRRFLLSFNHAEPDWSLFPYERMKDLPAIQWKLRNLKILKSKNPDKYGKQIRELEQLLG